MMDEPPDASDLPGGKEKAEIIPVATAIGRGPGASIKLRPGPVRSETPACPTTPAALWKSFRRRWPLALGLGVVFAAVVGAGAVLVVLPARYTSRSMLRVSMHPPKIIFETRDMYADYRTFQKTQTELIKSRLVLGPALRDPRVAALPVIKAQTDPGEWLERQVQVTFPNGSELLVISMTSPDPDELEPIVNAVVNAYMDTVVEDDYKARVERHERLRKMWNTYQDELKKKRASIRTIASAVGTDDRMTLVMKQGFLLENLQALDRELLGVQAELRRYRSVVAVIEAKQEGTHAGDRAEGSTWTGDPAPSVRARTTPEIEAEVEADEQVQRLRTRVDSIRRDFEKVRGAVRNAGDPALAVKWSNFKAARDDLEGRRLQLRQALIAGGKSGQDGDQAPSSLEEIKDRIAVREKDEAELRREIDRFRQDVAQLNARTIDLQTEQDEVQLADATAKRIGSEVEALDVEIQAPRRIVRLTSAEPPRPKDKARQVMICGGASFGAFALALFAVSFWEMRAMRIGSVDEVVNILGLPLVGTLPALPGPGSRLSKADDERWQGLLVESIDATRTMLLHASRSTTARAVMITSALKGEGKTSLAAHLATSLARAGRKTLLIDCDLRRPTLHQLFDVTRIPGLCELLRGEAELNDVIRPTPADDLNLIPAGHCDGLALQAIAQDGVRDILATLKRRYDFIIVDSAPVLPVVDTLLLSQQVDAVLFSIMRDVSRVPLVRAAHDRIASLGVRMLGAVVNAADRRDTMHTYDYEYQASLPA